LLIFQDSFPNGAKIRLLEMNIWRGKSNNRLASQLMERRIGVGAYERHSVTAHYANLAGPRKKLHWHKIPVVPELVSWIKSEPDAIVRAQVCSFAKLLNG
jgi:hypothetical protein